MDELCAHTAEQQLEKELVVTRIVAFFVSGWWLLKPLLVPVDGSECRPHPGRGI